MYTFVYIGGGGLTKVHRAFLSLYFKIVERPSITVKYNYSESSNRAEKYPKKTSHYTKPHNCSDHLFLLRSNDIIRL